MLLAILACCMLFFSGPVAAEQRVVRVGYPIQEGLSSIDDNGNYQGYTYEYLKEIARYTDWEYEFVQVEGDINTQLVTLMDMLTTGEIDLLGAMAYDDSLTEIWDYAAYNYGYSYFVLCTQEENAELTSGNFTSYQGLRVAVGNSSGNRSVWLDQFAESVGMTVEQVICTDALDQVMLLREGKVDALLATDVSIPVEGLKTIAWFQPRPFYFATTKGQKDLVNGLNMAIASINSADPYYATNLKNKYFGSHSDALYFSKAEQAYIEQAQPFRVLFMDGDGPLQYIDGSGDCRGVSVDMLADISAKTGLRFEPVVASDYAEYLRCIEEKAVDMVAVLSDGTQAAEQPDLRMTVSYVSLPMSLAVNRNVDMRTLDGKRLALAAGHQQPTAYSGEVRVYDTMADCIWAVEKGEADYCYGNSYSIQFYMRKYDCQNINMVPQAKEWSQEVCLGLTLAEKEPLVTILNKTIQSVSDQDLQSFIYTNSFSAEERTLWDSIANHPEQAALLALVVVLLFIVASLLWRRHHDKVTQTRRRLENERYEQISELSNEFLFEYEIQEDRLVLPEKSALFIGCDRIVEGLAAQAAALEEPESSVFYHMIHGEEGSKEICCRLSGGKQRWLRIITKKIKDQNGRTVYIVGKLLDIQQEKEDRDALLDRARRDSLTGVFNAAASRKMITNLLERGYGAFLIADIDHFKETNDTFGHFVGDEVLRELSQILLSVFRKEDIIGRLGGDEFVIFMQEVRSREIVEKKCVGLQQRVQSMSVSGEGVPVTLSIGIAMTQPGDAYDTIYKKADTALYAVKNRGRNGFELVE